MSDKKIPSSPEYSVGYGRPPKVTQFAPGKSGNPKGRPKGARSVAAILQGILQRKISVTENGRTRRIAALEVMLRRLANDAMRSDPGALKFLLALYDRYSDASASTLPFEDLRAEDRAILAQYLSKAIGDVSDDPSKVEDKVDTHGE